MLHETSSRFGAIGKINDWKVVTTDQYCAINIDIIKCEVGIITNYATRGNKGFISSKVWSQGFWRKCKFKIPKYIYIDRSPNFVSIAVIIPGFLCHPIAEESSAI